MRISDWSSDVCSSDLVDFSNQGRSRVMLKNRGKLRVYGSVRDGRFLGAEMAGPAMEHIAHLLAWAVQKELTIAEMLKMAFYHPVVEIGRASCGGRVFQYV